MLDKFWKEVELYWPEILSSTIFPKLRREPEQVLQNPWTNHDCLELGNLLVNLQDIQICFYVVRSLSVIWPTQILQYSIRTSW